MLCVITHFMKHILKYFVAFFAVLFDQNNVYGMKDN